jgi:hypothetical protein
MKPSNMAPSCCIVCGKPHPGGQNVPGWVYLAGAKPLGAIACSAHCGSIAGQRFARTGRVDAPEERGTCKGCGLALIINGATRTVSHQDPLCDTFKAIISRSSGNVEQKLELRDEEGNVIRTKKGRA